jgi:hypothetical protein
MGGRIPLPRTGGAPERAEGSVGDDSADVKSLMPPPMTVKLFSERRCQTQQGPSSSESFHQGRFMRPKALLLSILPIALAVAPSVARGQLSISRDCRDRYSWSASRFYDCSYSTEMAQRARAAAARARADARDAARWARSDARAYASAARAEAKAWDRNFSSARLRASELQIRLRDRAEARERARRERYDRRW